MASGTGLEELEVAKTQPARSAPETGLGFGDYTAERKEIFRNLTPANIVEGIEKMREQK